MTHPVGRPTVGAQPSPLPLAGTGGSSSLEGNDPVTMGTHKTLCVVECGGMDVQGSQTLAPTRSAWPILCLRIVGVCGMAPPPSSTFRCAAVKIPSSFWLIAFNLWGCLRRCHMQEWLTMSYALPLPCILPLVEAHLPLASKKLWFCLLNVSDIDSGLQVALLLSGEVCSIL